MWPNLRMAQQEVSKRALKCSRSQEYTQEPTTRTGIKNIHKSVYNRHECNETKREFHGYLVELFITSFMHKGVLLSLTSSSRCRCRACCSPDRKELSHPCHERFLEVPTLNKVIAVADVYSWKLGFPGSNSQIPQVKNTSAYLN
jgi:hypothetical protein